MCVLILLWSFNVLLTKEFYFSAVLHLSFESAWRKKRHFKYTNLRNNFFLVTKYDQTLWVLSNPHMRETFLFSYTVLYDFQLARFQFFLRKEENFFEFYQCAKTMHAAPSWVCILILPRGILVWCCLCCPLLLTFEWSMLQILLILGFFFWLRPEAYSNAARVIFWCFRCCSCILVLF